MKEKEFNKLLDKNKNQVFVMYTPLAIPLTFAVHYYFIINKKGKIARWDLLSNQHIKKGELHVQKDFIPPLRGFAVFRKWKRPRVIDLKRKAFEVKFVKLIEGNQANKIIKIIEESPKTYKYAKQYKMVPGPNSNTYAQWVIDQANINLKLSFRAVGKNWKEKK